MTRIRARWLVLLAVLIVATAAVVAWRLQASAVQDAVYDNVLTTAPCSSVPSAGKAQRVLDELPEFAGATAILVPYCASQIIEIQYDSHQERLAIESFLTSHGTHADTGWLLDGVPVQLRNV